MDSEEDVEELLAREQPTSFGMRDWTYERELLTLVAEEVRSLHSTLIAVHSRGKAPSVTPLPRPVTALDRLQRRQRLRRHEQRVALVLPTGS